MPSINRRDLVVGASTAFALLGLNARVAFSESPVAADLTAKGFFKFKVGDIEVTTISDGIWLKPHDAAFIKDVSVEQTKAALAAAGQPNDIVPIPFTVTVVRSGGRTIMFDSGTGAQLAPTAGKLTANMTAAGVDPAKIDMIVVTHFHPDHIFGLMQKDTNAQVFPTAEIVVPNAEYEFWADPGVLAKLPENRQGLAKRIQATLPSWKNVTRVENGAEVAPGVTAISAHGHTAGHTVYRVAAGKDQLMVLADITNIPALFVKNPGWHVVFDADPVMAEASRRRMFDQVIADKSIMTGYHYGMPGAGRIEKDGSGYAFVPLV